MTTSEFVTNTWKDNFVRWNSNGDEIRYGTYLSVNGKEFYVKNSVGNMELYLTPEQTEEIWNKAYNYTIEHLAKITELEKKLNF